MKVIVVTRDPSLESRIAEALTPNFTAEAMPPERIRDALAGPVQPQAAVVDMGTARGAVGELARSGLPVLALGDARDASQILAALRDGASDFADRGGKLREIRSAVHRLGLAGDAYLELDRTGAVPQYFSLAGRSAWALGRDPTNDIVFKDEIVSRFHAVVRRTPAGFELEDRGSRHGTYVNEERIAGPVLLAGGDRIRLGKPGAPELVFRRTQSPASRQNPAARPGDDPRLLSERELRDLASILDTFLKLKGDLLLEDVLALVLTRVIEFTGAERGLLLLVEEEGTENAAIRGSRTTPRLSLPLDGSRILRLVLARNRDGSPVSAADLRISHKIPTDVARSGRGAIVLDLLETHPETHLATIELGLRSILCVPLKARWPGTPENADPAVLGVIYVDSRDRARPFSSQLLAALEPLASEAAQAIVRARLFEESLEKQRIDEEMAIAREIQTNLLPPGELDADWVELRGTSEPSRAVGGDLMDYHLSGGDRLGVLVGDVSGKGIPAALFSALVDGHFHALISAEEPSAQLGRRLEALNLHLIAKSRLRKFVTLVIAILGRDGRLVYANAGHNPPLLVRSGCRVERLERRGMLMGMLEEARYEAYETQLQPGDTLILYSDGITEAQGPGRERFGERRLLDAALEACGGGARAVHDAILASLRDFTAGTPPTDDVTLLVLAKK